MTPYQQKIVARLKETPGVPVSAGGILDALEVFDASPDVVKVQICYTRKKHPGIRNRIETVRGKGYRWVGDVREGDDA